MCFFIQIMITYSLFQGLCYIPFYVFFKMHYDENSYKLIFVIYNYDKYLWISFLQDKLNPYWGINNIFHHMKCIKRLERIFSWVIYKSMHFFYQQISIQMGKIWVAIFVFTLCKSNLRYIERMCGNFLLLLDTIHIS